MSSWEAFRRRVRVEAGKIGGGVSLLIGGLPAGNPREADGMPPPYFQAGATAAASANRRAARSSCQRRRCIRHRSRRSISSVSTGASLWCAVGAGASRTILITLAVDAALSGKRVGVFAPTRTLLSPLLMEIARALRSVPGVSINTVLGEMRLPNGGHVDFWSIDHTQRAGRGRKYHLALIDEAAHDEGYLKDAFSTAIAPTLLDYAGSIIEASTPNGVSPDNHFWQTAHLARARLCHPSRPDLRQPAFAAGGDQGLAGDDAAGDRVAGARRSICQPRRHVDLPVGELAGGW